MLKRFPVSKLKIKNIKNLCFICTSKMTQRNNMIIGLRQISKLYKHAFLN